MYVIDVSSATLFVETPIFATLVEEDLTPGQVRALGEVVRKEYP